MLRRARETLLIYCMDPRPQHQPAKPIKHGKMNKIYLVKIDRLSSSAGIQCSQFFNTITNHRGTYTKIICNNENKLF